MIIGLICVGIFFLIVYMVLLYLFYNASLMLAIFVPTILCLLAFFLIKEFTPSSYEKLLEKELPKAIKDDEEEVRSRLEETKKRIDVKIAQNNTKLAEARAQLQLLHTDIEACQVIPKYYKNSGMIRIIESYIRSGRADSVKQAINLYEKDKLTSEVYDAEKRAAQATSVEDMKKEAFKSAVSHIRDEEYAHESKMRDIEKRRSELEFEHEILSDELERGRKINKYKSENED